jgi:hypothetical protein
MLWQESRISRLQLAAEAANGPDGRLAGQRLRAGQPAKPRFGLVPDRARARYRSRFSRLPVKRRKDDDEHDDEDDFG